MSLQPDGTTNSPPPLTLGLEGLEAAIGITRSELEHHLRLMAALKMFELGKVSSGTGAQLAGLSRIDFFDACSRYRVSPFNLPSEEFENELIEEMKQLET